MKVRNSLYNVARAVWRWRVVKHGQFMNWSGKRRCIFYSILLPMSGLMGATLNAGLTVSFLLGFLLLEFAVTICAGLFDQPVKVAPGAQLLGISEFVFSKRKFQLIVVPAISDMREEYFEALSQNRIWKARWVRVRGTYSFFAAIGLDRALAFVSFFIKAWKSVN